MFFGESISNYFVWTGGFKNQFTDIWTWCKRYNQTLFGLHPWNKTTYNYSENHEAYNDTQYDPCSKFAFSFDGGLRCVDGGNGKELRTVCESTSNLTYADLVKIYFLQMIVFAHQKS
jgi:hypothetical protein